MEMSQNIRRQVEFDQRNMVFDSTQGNLRQFLIGTSCVTAFCSFSLPARWFPAIHTFSARGFHANRQPCSSTCERWDTHLSGSSHDTTKLAILRGKFGMGQNPVITPGEHQNSWDLWIALNIDLKWEAKFGHKGTPPQSMCSKKPEGVDG